MDSALGWILALACVVSVFGTGMVAEREGENKGFAACCHQLGRVVAENSKGDRVCIEKDKDPRP